MKVPIGAALHPGDLAHSYIPVFHRRVNNAMAVIQEALEIGKIGVSFSGGKDSTVLLDLVRRVYPDAPAAFYDSGCEYQWTYEMVEHYGVSTIKPEANLLDMCRYVGKWGYRDPVRPDMTFDFTEILVFEPSARFVRENDLKVAAIGLRGEESKGRWLNARVNGTLYPTAGGTYHLCPLANWSHSDVWAYIASRDLRYNHAYDRMAKAGIPRENWRISTLLGLCGAATMGRYSCLKQVDRESWNELVSEFPDLMRWA